MKKRLFAPLVLTSLGLALAGCGGESSTVNEDPYKGAKPIQMVVMQILQKNV